MPTILRCQDQWGREVTVSNAQWRTHIVVGHPELTNNLDCIRAAITDPHCVTHDLIDADGENFYRGFTLPSPFDRSYLKVCVRFATGRSGTSAGFVVTAYATFSIKRGEPVKWQL